MLKRVLLAAIFAGACLLTVTPEAECNDCPPYNSPCISDISCGFRCGMTCQEVPRDYRRRCR